MHDVYAAWAPANGPFSGLEARVGIDNLFDKSYKGPLAGDSGKGRAFKLTFVKQF